mmetsp:Transcript_20356/g.36210  ORF Transcript_20356/g.36210 Transcript_20356/m.36210 type:complete len:427 (+) Transcript_20356:270-1550(+)
MSTAKQSVDEAEMDRIAEAALQEVEADDIAESAAIEVLNESGAEQQGAQVGSSDETNDMPQDSHAVHDENNPLGQMQKRVNGFLRGYLGEEITNKFERKQNKLASKIKKEVEAHIPPGMRVYEHLFPLLQAPMDTAADGEASAPTAPNPPKAITEEFSPFWVERTSSWMDTMQPQGRIWLELALPTSLLPRDADLSFALDENLKLSEIQEHQLRLDIPRTYPSIEYFEDPSVLSSFERLLRAVAIACPDLGYVQGMNFLVAYVLIHSKTEDVALRIIIEMMTNPKYNLRDVFAEGLSNLMKLTDALKIILHDRDPELADHLEAQGIDQYFFAFQWVVTLFAYSMPFDALQHVWDIFFAKSWEGFFAICMVLISDQRETLITSEFEGLCSTLKECARNPRSDFYERANKVAFSTAIKAVIRDSTKSK